MCPPRRVTHASGIPYGDGFVKNRYVGRTFIQPSQKQRGASVRLKLNPLRDNIKGKRLVVVDDSIVRGTTTRQTIALLREAGGRSALPRVVAAVPVAVLLRARHRQALRSCSRPTCRSVRSRTTSASTRSRISTSIAWWRPPGRRPRRSAAPVLHRRVPRSRSPTRTPSSCSKSTPALHVPGTVSERVTTEDDNDKLTYADAGVDIAAGEKAVELIKAHVRSTFRPEVVGDIGGFGGLFAVDWKRYRDPLLVSSTDGVGTKSVIARLADRRNTIGIDCVAMSVDDIAAQGAEPLFFLDYISIGKLVPEEIDELVQGVAEMPPSAAALLGGEMSEHPGVMEPGEFDLVGFAVGVVERDATLPRDVRAGDRIIGIASPGLRCNGYSLARAALLERDRSRSSRSRLGGRAPFARRRAPRAERDLRAGHARAGDEGAGPCVRARDRRRHPPTTWPGYCPIAAMR